MTRKNNLLSAFKISNKWSYAMGFSDSLTLAEDGLFVLTNIATFSGTEDPRAGFMMHKGKVTRMVWFVNTNAFTASSTNTFTVVFSSVDTGMVITVASGAGTGLFTVAGNEQFEIDDRVGIRFNSDSVGAATIRSWGIGGHYD